MNKEGEGAAQGGVGPQEHGKARVRHHLIAPLEALGLRRPAGVTAEVQRTRLDALAERLAYMDAANLDTLADAVAAQAERAGGTWPAPIVICGWAQGIEPRPFAENRIVHSWLASVEGPRARAGGWLVPLLRFLRRRAMPPTDFDKRLIREEADRDRRTAAVYAERRDRGTASAEECAWLDAWHRDEAAAMAIVAEGDARRRGAAA